MTLAHLYSRMGMAPRFCAPPSTSCPLARNLVYGDGVPGHLTVGDLARELLIPELITQAAISGLVQEQL